MVNSKYRITLILLFLLFFAFSCNNKKDDEFEIYLINKRIPSKNSVLISTLTKSEKFKDLVNNVPKDTEIDTINNQIIFGGEFEVSNKYLNRKPFIEMNEIISLDTLNGEIMFSEKGSSKLNNLKTNMKGVQFVICLNKKIIFTGYFWTTYSSYIGSWNCIEYDHTKKNNSNNFKIYKANGMNNNKSKINFSSYPELIKFLKSRNKLK